MRIDNFSRTLFWSYKNSADLPIELIIRQISNYGEINDIKKMFELIGKKIILENLRKLDIQNKKRINFIKKIWIEDEHN